MSAIWRPTPSHDLGVDGQIEFLEVGTVVSTGHLLAVQSKSGPSYFKNRDGKDFLYYPAARHRIYWTRLLLPVILTLYKPESDLLIYASVKPQLANGGPIRVPESNVFNDDARIRLLEIACEGVEVFDPAGALEKFRFIKLERDHGQVISGIEFLLASVNREGGFFSLRMARISSVFSLLSTEDSFGISSDDYEYIFRCCLEFESLRLAESYIAEFNEVWFGLQMVPDLAVPLNERGRELMKYLWDNLREYVSAGAFEHLGISDQRGLADRIAQFAQSESDRRDRSDRLGVEPR